MITQFTCSCGANKPEQAKYYDGAVGYEAIVCRKCGRLYDHEGEHKADEWSRKFVGLPLTTSDLFKKHFGNVASVNLNHPKIENFFNELNEICLQEDKNLKP